jgi:hypothetical protein
MRKAIITTIVTGLIGFGGIAAPMAAFADTPPGGTSTTLGVTGGDLTITVAGSASLGAVNAGQSSLEGQLGTVTVQDMRAEYNGAWNASAVASDFANSDVPDAADIPATDITYSPGSATDQSGDATFQAGAGGAMSTVGSVDAFSTADEVGVASVSWDPNISFALPSNVVAGTYTGTVTHSVA